MHWKHTTRILVALGIAACGAASDEPSSATARAPYALFKVIADRNIFNPGRVPHRREARRTNTNRAAPADTFALVGTMSYEKGTFAFFDGSSTNYRQVLKRGGEIAGFTVTAIHPDGVVLAAGTNPVALPVGAHLRRDEDTGWRVAATNRAAAAAETNAPAAADDAPAEPNDVLRKLMQQREQQLK